MTISEQEVLDLLDGLEIRSFGSRDECNICKKAAFYQIYAFQAPIAKIFRCVKCFPFHPGDKREGWLIEKL